MEQEVTYQAGEGGRIAIPESTLLLYDDPNRTDPEPEHVREVLKRGLLTGSRAGNLVGVSSRTIRKWTGGDQKISYSAWRMLLYYCGLISEMPTMPNQPIGVGFAPGQEPS